MPPQLVPGPAASGPALNPSGLLSLRHRPHQPQLITDEDNRGPYEDNRGPYEDNRGLYEDNRGPYEDNRGPYEDNRGPYEDNRGPEDNR
ncbi:hypothetical protein STEG23_035373 [Scotinomys teguina]